MRLLKLGALLAVQLAIFVGLVGKLKPHWFLQLPNGFILMAMLGHGMPPFTDRSVWQEDNFREFMRDGDLIVATGTKSGTTWMCYCADRIRRKGSEKVGLPYTDIMYTTPWLEQRQTPGLDWADVKHLWNSTILSDGSKLKDYWDHKNFPFRIFKSHATPLALPIRQFPKVKFLAMSRKGEEVAESVHTFAPKHSEEFRKRWGGAPPIQQPEETVRMLLPDGILANLYFNYVKEWWPFRNEQNVLLLHYADAKRDLMGTVKKLASFLDVDLTKEELEQVTYACSYKHMKEVQDNFQYRQPLNPTAGPIFAAANFLGQGKTGGGFKLTGELKSLWEKAVETQFHDPLLRKWANEGGEW